MASVSCIYGLGSPESYHEMVLSLHKGQETDRDAILRRLVAIQYERNDLVLERGTFRVRGDVIEVFPAGYSNKAVRIELFGDEVDRILEFEVLTGKVIGERLHSMIFQLPIMLLIGRIWNTPCPPFDRKWRNRSNSLNQKIN